MNMKVLLIHVKHSNILSTMFEILLCSYFLVFNMEYLLEPTEEDYLTSNQMNNIIHGGGGWQAAIGRDSINNGTENLH